MRDESPTIETLKFVKSKGSQGAHPKELYNHLESTFRWGNDRLYVHFKNIYEEQRDRDFLIGLPLNGKDNHFSIGSAPPYESTTGSRRDSMVFAEILFLSMKGEAMLVDFEELAFAMSQAKDAKKWSIFAIAFSGILAGVSIVLTVWQMNTTATVRLQLNASQVATVKVLDEEVLAIRRKLQDLETRMAKQDHEKAVSK